MEFTLVKDDRAIDHHLAGHAEADPGFDGERHPVPGNSGVDRGLARLEVPAPVGGKIETDLPVWKRNERGVERSHQTLFETGQADRFRAGPGFPLVRREGHGHPVKVGGVILREMLEGGDEAAVA